MSTSRNTHPLNVSYLVVGLVFLGIAGSWALREAGVVDLGEIRWLFPTMLVAAGLVGVVAMVGKGVSGREKPRDDELPGQHDDETIHEGETR